MHFLFPVTVVLLGFSYFGPSPVAAASSEYSVKEKVSSPRGWMIHSRPHPDHNINLQIGLSQPNFLVLEKNLYEVSDPSHEHYGQHLSKSEVDALVAPHPESLNLVNEWLGTFGVNEDSLVRSSAGDWVTLTVLVSLAEKMLDTTYYVWKHSESGDYLVRTTSYGLPGHLLDHIDLILPTTKFGRLKQHKSTIVSLGPDAVMAKFDPNATGIDSGFGVTVNPSCNKTINIKCLQELYNAVGVVPSAANNSIAMTGYLEQFANIEDLQLFYADQVPKAVGTNFTFVSVAGGTNNQTPADAGDEANLDTQFAFGLSHPITPTFYSTAGSPPLIPDAVTLNKYRSVCLIYVSSTIAELQVDTLYRPYTVWLDFVLAQAQLPLAISTSYGDDEQTVPKSFAIRACAGFTQLGARGISVRFSSGDRGVGDGDPNPATQKCFTNDGRNVTKFIPNFPASVTTVGGTTNVPEVAVTRFFSGGGFSNYFPRPAYQEAVVDAYLNTLPKGTYSGLFNRPIRMLQHKENNLKIFLKGQALLVGGTSCSAPTFTGIVSLLNDARLNAGLPPLAFLNPFLYSIGFAGLNDITIGNNSGCGTQGFNATKGWDPVTGLGTPN